MITPWLEDTTPRTWTILVAVVMGFGGMTTASIVVIGYWGTDLLELSGPFGVRNPAIVVVAGISTLISGGWLWWFLVETTDNTRSSNGARFGALTAISSHILTIFSIVFVQWFPQLVVKPTPDLVVGLLVSSASFGLLSVLGFGLVTIPVGVALGVVLIRLRRSGIDDSPIEDPGSE